MYTCTSTRKLQENAIIFYICSSGVSLDISTRSGFNRARWNTGRGTSQSTETRTYIAILKISTSVV